MPHRWTTGAICPLAERIHLQLGVVKFSVERQGCRRQHQTAPRRPAVDHRHGELPQRGGATLTGCLAIKVSRRPSGSMPAKHVTISAVRAATHIAPSISAAQTAGCRGSPWQQPTRKTDQLAELLAPLPAKWRRVASPRAGRPPGERRGSHQRDSEQERGSTARCVSRCDSTARSGSRIGARRANRWPRAALANRPDKLTRDRGTRR